MEQSKGKLILAVLQGDDYENCVRALNKAGFFATLLSSTGGFLKKRSTTLMIGVEESQLDETLGIIKEKSSRRHSVVVPVTGLPYSAGSTAMPLKITVGGATVFVVTVDQFVKF